MTKATLHMRMQIVLGVLCIASAVCSAKDAAPPEWPLKIEGARAPIVIYQPQPDSFKEDKLTARAAVSIQHEGMDPVFGAIWIESRVETDREARTVTVKDIRVTRSRFAGSTPEKEQLLSQILTDALSKNHFVIALDRLSASLENVQRETQTAADLRNDPPVIYVEQSETSLIILDGEPQLRPVADSKDQRVVNTPYTLMQTPDKRWKLKAGDHWLTAADLKGPWKDEANASAAVPKILISTVPAELIVSKGEPTYSPLPGNELLYMTNTEGNVFVETATSKTFVLLSGRWYAAPSLKGPWTFIRPDELPPAFAKIPPDSPKSSVLVSVAGTEAANEALLDAQIPQTAVVNRKEFDKKLKVEWDGKPQFKHLEVVEVEYSLNASVPVFKVGKEGYWACDTGMWYFSKKPTGPWKVADRVPEDIYKIPPKCPHYNCRYVYVYHATPEVVYVGYYPGYVGSYPYYGVVVYGTGYPYSGYYGTSAYYGPTVTFGFGFSYYPYYGWGGGYPIYPAYPVRPGGDWGRPGRPGDIAPRPTPHPSGDRPQAKQNVYNNNVFADRDGNVSRRNENGKWQDRTDRGWKDKSAPSRDVQRDSQARDRGAQRAASRPSYSGGMGGGMRGGGGRGGGRR